MKKLLALLITIFAITTLFSQVQINGKVEDDLTSKPLSKAKVVVIGNNESFATTDSLGNFTLNANENDSLVIECNGYYKAKLKILKTNNLIIKLEDAFPIYSIVDTPTQFPGGLSKFYEYIEKNLKHTKKNKVHGRIFVQFAIDTTGYVIVDKTKVVKAVNEKISKEIHEAYDPEIVQVVNQSPAWIPARQRGQKVKQQMALPINF